MPAKAKLKFVCIFHGIELSLSHSHPTAHIYTHVMRLTSILHSSGLYIYGVGRAGCASAHRVCALHHAPSLECIKTRARAHTLDNPGAAQSHVPGRYNCCWWLRIYTWASNNAKHSNVRICNTVWSALGLWRATHRVQYELNTRTIGEYIKFMVAIAEGSLALSSDWYRTYFVRHTECVLQCVLRFMQNCSLFRYIQYTFGAGDGERRWVCLN